MYYTKINHLIHYINKININVNNKERIIPIYKYMKSRKINKIDKKELAKLYNKLNILYDENIFRDTMNDLLCINNMILFDKIDKYRCPICLEYIKNSNDIVQFQCNISISNDIGHIFCRNCVKQYINIDMLEVIIKCPLCRRNYHFEKIQRQICQEIINKNEIKLIITHFKRLYELKKYNKTYIQQFNKSNLSFILLQLSYSNGISLNMDKSIFTLKQFDEWIKIFS